MMGEIPKIAERLAKVPLAPRLQSHCQSSWAAGPCAQAETACLVQAGRHAPRAAGPNPLCRAPNSGLDAHAKFFHICMGPAQQRNELLACGGAGVFRGIVTAVCPDLLMPDSLQRIGTAGLQGLDPAARLAPQSPCQACPRQAPVAGVQVHRRERCTFKSRRTARHLGGEFPSRTRGDEELQFDFLLIFHCGSRQASARRGAARVGLRLPVLQRHGARATSARSMLRQGRFRDGCSLAKNAASHAVDTKRQQT